jgi:hypothetical protein
MDKLKQFLLAHDDVIALIVLMIGTTLTIWHFSDEAKLMLGGGLALLKGKSTGNGQ